MDELVKTKNYKIMTDAKPLKCFVKFFVVLLKVISLI